MALAIDILAYQPSISHHDPLGDGHSTEKISYDRFVQPPF